ncbi:amino acid transporter [Aquipseudomonas alcaligenes]|uniref:Amino acid transporter n=1 Tax=Aquipseudomonas alcaligenes TaxID=43263 RepID=A0A2V4KQK3_AQUAC|nr:LysE family transporter [Pseudomonas alcaligenes]PYC20244.1 amino acid transporter [Pseudomonas alcaligenes]
MTEWMAVVIITILAVISPGPDFAMVSRNALVLSRRAGVLTAIGIGLGVLVHVAYTLVGIGVLLQGSSLAFGVLKFCGAVYLVYLGVKMLRSTPAVQVSGGESKAISDVQALRVGFLTNALNPKTSIFIVSLFLQVVSPGTSKMVQVGYGLYISLAHVVWFSLVAVFLAAGPIRERILSKGHWIDRVFGFFLVGFGVSLAIPFA